MAPGCSSTSCTGWTGSVGQAANAPQNSRITASFLVMTCHHKTRCRTHLWDTHPHTDDITGTCSPVGSIARFIANCFSAAAGFVHTSWMVSGPRLPFMSQRTNRAAPNKSLKTLQQVQNAAAEVLSRTRKREFFSTLTPCKT